jgi:hypothetical protein
VIDGTSVLVYGSGEGVDPHPFGDDMNAALYQAEVEPALVLDGWTLEQLTTERRPDPPDILVPRSPQRRLGTLRLVPQPDESLL